MPNIPDPKFAALEMPWARAMQSTLESMAADLERRSQNDLNVNQGQSEIIRHVGDNIVQVDAKLTAAVNALTLAGIPGDLDQSRVTGTWDKGVSTAQQIRTTTDTTVGGIIRNISAYSNPITTSFRSVWVTSVDGQFGFNLSSREFKQDIANATVDPKLILQLRAVTYRYIQAVETYGDDAEVEFGLIAEEVHDLGLHFLVDYDPETGKPAGIKFHLIAIALLSTLDDHETRLMAMETLTHVGAQP
jgi:hypothetical protein